MACTPTRAGFLRARQSEPSTTTVRLTIIAIATGAALGLRAGVGVGMVAAFTAGLGVPLALGSWWGLILVLVTVPLLVLRIFDEERMLRSQLEGYEAYTRHVRYRLVPALW